MASTTDIRKWARDQGLEAGVKGPVSAEVREQYEAAHPGPGSPAAAGDVAEAGPPPAAADPRQAERTPAKPSKSTDRGRGLGLFARFGRAAGEGRAARGRRSRKAGPRVSIANLIEDAWGQMAWAASPLPPMQRLLQAQAPFAGIALEDALAGTVIDRALQPVARAEDKAKAVGGLMFPPMALMLVLATAPQPNVVTDPSTNEQTHVWPEPSMQHKTALMTLRWSLMLWAEAGQARLGEYMARAEANADRGRQADEFMGWILGVPEEAGDQAEAEAVTAEEEAVRRAQAMFGADGDTAGP